MTAEGSRPVQVLGIVKGDIFYVKDWPGQERGSRYLAVSFDTVARSQWPEQVICFQIEHWPGAKYPKGVLGAYRAFPAPLCVQDPKRTKQWRTARS